jgi:prefoldin subunit 5
MTFSDVVIIELCLRKTTNNKTKDINTNMKSLKQFNQLSNEFEQLDEETQQQLLEISIGKISTTVLIGRLKLLSRKIKDITIRKSLMSLGYMIYTVSLQSRSIEGIEKKLDQLIRLNEQNEQELRRLKLGLNK